MTDFNVVGLIGLDPITPIGDNYMLQGIGFPLRPVSTSPGGGSGAILSIKDFGALMDGSDDGPAIQASIDQVGYAFIPKGTANILTTVTQRSFSAIFGLGMGISIIQPHPSMPLETALITNQVSDGNGVRRTFNTLIHDITIDGATRSYPVWPAANWEVKGNLIEYKAVDTFRFSRVEIKNHQRIAISFSGPKDGIIEGCNFHDNGTRYIFTPPVWISCRGTDWAVSNITSANPAVVTLFGNQAASGLTSMRLYDIVGMTNIPDGLYPCVDLGNKQFSLTGVDTTGQPTYTPDLLAFAGASGTTGNAFVLSENIIITGNTFYNNAFHHCNFHVLKGGTFIGNRLQKSGESSVYCEGSHDVVFSGNSFIDTSVVAIVASGIELNRCANVTVAGNLMADTGTSAMTSNGGQNIAVIGNTFSRIISDNQQTYPDSPEHPGGGGLVGKNAVFKVQGIEELSTSGYTISGNTVVDLRAAPQAEEVVDMLHSGTVPNTIRDLVVEGNNWARSGVAPANMINISSNTVIQPASVIIANNLGHASQAPVTITATLSATGIVTYDVGFVPSSVEIIALGSTASTSWTSRTTLRRDVASQAPGSLGVGVRSSITDAGGVSSAIIADSAYIITDGAGVVQAQAEFEKWVATTTNIGFSLNVTVATIPVDVVMVCHP